MTRAGLAMFLAGGMAFPQGVERTSSAVISGPIVVLDLEAEIAGLTLEAMTREIDSIFAPSGVWLTWRTLQQARRETYEGEVVILKLADSALLQGLAESPGGRPLGYAYTSGDSVLAFCTVLTDRVRTSIARHLREEDALRSSLFLGRALGRVASHELFHVLAGTACHGSEGITRPILSSEELILGQLALSKQDQRTLQGRLAARAPVKSSALRFGEDSPARLAAVALLGGKPVPLSLLE